MTYLVCYDICNPKRLVKTAKLLEKFGIRVQYSFFELDISDDMLEKLLCGVKMIINPKEDKFYLYPICTGCRDNAIIDGSGKLLKMETFIIL